MYQKILFFGILYRNLEDDDAIYPFIDKVL